MTGCGETIQVTVVCALPDRAIEFFVRLPAGATVADALECPELAVMHPDVNVAGASVGIFGKLARRDTALAQGDRVEVYRPLIADPKTRRIKRAARTKSAAR